MNSFFSLNFELSLYFNIIIIFIVKKICVILLHQFISRLFYFSLKRFCNVFLSFMH